MEFIELSEHRLPISLAGICLSVIRPTSPSITRFEPPPESSISRTWPRSTWSDRALAPRYISHYREHSGDIAVGRAKYSLLLNDEGCILDDLVVYRTGEEEFLVVANAGNRFVAVEAIRERARGYECVVRERFRHGRSCRDPRPNSFDILDNIDGLEADGLAELGYYRCLSATFHGTAVLIGRHRLHG